MWSCRWNVPLPVIVRVPEPFILDDVTLRTSPPQLDVTCTGNSWMATGNFSTSAALVCGAEGAVGLPVGASGELCADDPDDGPVMLSELQFANDTPAMRAVATIGATTR